MTCLKNLIWIYNEIDALMFCYGPERPHTRLPLPGTLAFGNSPETPLFYLSQSAPKPGIKTVFFYHSSGRQQTFIDHFCIQRNNNQIQAKSNNPVNPVNPVKKGDLKGLPQMFSQKEYPRCFHIILRYNR